MNLVKMTRHDGHAVNVHPEMVEDYKIGGYVVDDDQSDAEPVSQSGGAVSEGIGTDSGDQFSDEQLREIITKETGKAPHPRLGRNKLVEQFNALNAAAAEGEA